MCELLVVDAERRSDDPYLDAGLLHRGDVVTIQADGWEWGRMEGPPDFRIIRVPGVDGVLLENLLGRDFRTEVEQRAANRRFYTLDIDALPDVASLDEVRAAMKRRPGFVDPNVIG